MRTASGLILAATVLAGALAAAPPPNSGPPANAKFKFGIVAFDFHPPIAQKIAELGVGWVRGACAWSDLEPARGAFVWNCADDLVTGAQRLGLFSYVSVSCTPAWANGGRACEAMPTDVADWYEFVRQFVARYTHYRTMLGVWNEPNLTLEDGADAHNYALLFVNAASARDAVNPLFRLAALETSHHAVATGYYVHAIDAIRAVHALAPQDVVTVHWYPDGPPLIPYLDTVHDAAGSQEVWLSETGLASADGQAQAQFIGRMIATFMTSDRPWWTRLIVYRLWDGVACCTEAILNSDYSNRPAFDAYRSALVPQLIPAPTHTR